MGRNDGRCYAKPVIGGQTEQALSEEESDALKMAMGGGLKAFAEVPQTNGRKRDRKVLRAG